MTATMYIDSRGWKYRVMPGLGGVFKTRYQRPEKTGETGWKSYSALPWRQTEEEAQADLDYCARIKGWRTWGCGSET